MGARRREDLLDNLRENLRGTQLVPWETTITAAQMAGAFAAGLTVTDLPGASRIIIPELVVLEKQAGAAYTGAITDVQIGYGAAAAPATLAPVAFSVAAAAFLLTSTALENRILRPRATTGGAVFPDFSGISSTGPVDLRNKALYLKVTGAAPGAGSPVKVHIYGRIVPVNLTFSW